MIQGVCWGTLWTLLFVWNDGVDEERVEDDPVTVCGWLLVMITGVVVIGCVLTISNGEDVLNKYKWLSLIGFDKVIVWIFVISFWDCLSILQPCIFKLDGWRVGLDFLELVWLDIRKDESGHSWSTYLARVFCCFWSASEVAWRCCCWTCSYTNSTCQLVCIWNKCTY